MEEALGCGQSQGYTPILIIWIVRPDFPAVYFTSMLRHLNAVRGIKSKLLS